MALLVRSVGGLSKYFYLSLWLAYLNADVIGQSMNKRGVALALDPCLIYDTDKGMAAGRGTSLGVA